MQAVVAAVMEQLMCDKPPVPVRLLPNTLFIYMEDRYDMNNVMGLGTYDTSKIRLVLLISSLVHVHVYTQLSFLFALTKASFNFIPKFLILFRGQKPHMT